MFETVVAWLGLLSLLSAGVPLWRAWRALKDSSLSHAVIWLGLAWLAWLFAGVAPLTDLAPMPLLHIALCLSAATLVAVFGARRPGVTAWNFVVAGLLAVLLMPLIEQDWNSPHWRLDAPRAIFLASILLVGCTNYMPTRLGLCAFLAGITFAIGLSALAAGHARYMDISPFVSAAQFIFFMLIWNPSHVSKRPLSHVSSFDERWLRFRDRYGLVWGLRVIEQYNSAAGHANLKGRLRWSGLASPEASTEVESGRLLDATLKRFGLSANH